MFCSSFQKIVQLVLFADWCEISIVLWHISPFSTGSESNLPNLPVEHATGQWNVKIWKLPVAYEIRLWSMASIIWNLALSPMSFCNPKPFYHFRIWRLFLIDCQAIYESCYVHLECLVPAEPFSNVKMWAAPQTADWRCMCISIVSHYGFLILVGNGGYCIHSFCCSRAWDVIEFPKLKSWYQQNLELIELIMQSLETLTNLTQYKILKMYLEIQDLNWRPTSFHPPIS